MQRGMGMSQPMGWVGVGPQPTRVGASRLEGVGHPKLASRQMGWEI